MSKVRNPRYLTNLTITNRLRAHHGAGGVQVGGFDVAVGGAPTSALCLASTWRGSQQVWVDRRRQLLHRNVQRFRGGLVFEARRPLYHSPLGLRVINKIGGAYRLEGLTSQWAVPCACTYANALAPCASASPSAAGSLLQGCRFRVSGLGSREPAHTPRAPVPRLLPPVPCLGWGFCAAILGFRRLVLHG